MAFGLDKGIKVGFGYVLDIYLCKILFGSLNHVTNFKIVHTVCNATEKDTY